MKKTYHMEVDCANCAAKMENAANKIAGVSNAVVNYMAQKLTVEFADGADTAAVMQAVYAACKKIEEDCEIYL